MHRSSSGSRVSDEYSSSNMHHSSSGSRVSDEYSDHPPSNQSFRSESATTTADQLPKYNPQSYVANKERSRLKSAETAVHLIPLLLVLCGIILWFFSTPVDLVHKDGPFVARIGSLNS